MHDDESVAARLAELREAWPQRSDVQSELAADASVNRHGRTGTGFLAIALACTGAWAVPLMLFGSHPVQGAVQNGLAMLYGVVSVCLMLGSVFFGVLAGNEFLHPRRQLRQATWQRFAQARGLEVDTRVRGISRKGFFFGEPSPNDRGYLGEAYRRVVGMYAGRSVATRETDLHIGVAHANFHRSPYGPYRKFRYLSLRLPGEVPHLVLDSRTNGSLAAQLSGRQRVSLEGNFDAHFTTYAHERLGRESREILTPDVMWGFIDYGTAWDAEFSGDRVTVVSRKHGRRHDRDDVTAMMVFAELVGDQVARQAVSYGRATPRSQNAVPNPRMRWRFFDVGAVVSALVIFGTPLVVWATLT